ncbi:ABC-2 type transport system ATP-binding protein [Microbacterium halimionae]|uniref:ABC-2 type transport system ATP-binding protein n=1 Tax=Microbacterium halimionae TaxID=1526413 RepID=A0A7W3JM64_9MICO|nr:ABC transporter ATP-binding protein [Microbacterium halimionae]MBA8815380.1 ABC-2 type transport system ATP-binding protein [Microbacterium halimionae]NII95427.1 ABC-2 type transport system ATP-binding protein [Microbacterium halimionae]
MENAAVRVRNLRKLYGSNSAVDDVSFDIEQGETFALLGPNGAGKSTTVEILEGYRNRTSGDVSVVGVDPSDGNLAWRARLGIVLQSTGQAASFTVREQLRQFAGYYPRPRNVEEVIAAVGLEEKATTQISKLSGGQQRRVDVALGIIGRPELLFLDEPTTGFDPQARREFWDLIRQLKREGTTILLTTHYLDEAAQLADRVAVINHGKLQAIGPLDTFGGEKARMPVVHWREGDQRREHRTSEPWAFVSALADRSGGEPPELEIRRPTLEDIYLGMVAHDVKEEIQQ